jgi:anti-sigma factor ChrR (cupin superfamily)
LLRAVSETSRFERFADLVARALGVGSALGQRLLDGIDRAANWTESPWPGVQLYHLEGPLGDAPIARQAVVGFVRLKPGVAFPTHRHLGEETVVVVQGSLEDEDGSVSGPGAVVVRGAGSEHAFTALPGPDLVYLAVIRDGVAFGEVVMRPGSADV